MKKISRNSALNGPPTPSSSMVVGSHNNTLLSSPSRSGEMRFEEAAIPIQYPHRLSLYLQAPDYEITIEDFEELALARLELLKAVETAGIRNLRDEELISWIRRYEQKHLPLHGNNVAGRFPLYDERRRDEASQYILRLAFCGAVSHDSISLTDSSGLNSADEARRWFVNQEVSLLRYRLMILAGESRSEREEFLNNAMASLLASGAVSLLSQDEKSALMTELKSIHSPEQLTDEFYQVPWEFVPELVGKRAAILKRGKAFVPRSDCLYIVINRYKEELEASLERIARQIPFLRDDRLVPLLDALRRCDYSLDAAMASTAGSSAATLGALLAADIDRASVHFPLCMQNLHRNLRADRHLKFNGRQQYGLFLKSIGLTLTEALQFWRAAFAPKYSSDQFNKEYAYNVRHNYGQEGKRANYASYSCAKICAGHASGPGEYHGCPYKHTNSADKLASLLSNYTGPNGIKLTAPHIKEVVSLAADGSHYQLACTRVFELTRAKPPPTATETVTYPHKYYEASVLSAKK